MADPLTQAAESLAPAPAGPTNMFDPNPGRNVIARYGNAAALGRDIENTLRLDAMARNSRLGAMREQEFMAEAPLREREREVALLGLDEDEQSLLDKKEARALRTEFIRGLAQIDPTADDYAAARRDIVGSIPPGVLEDPAVRDILATYDDQAREAQYNRQRGAEMARQQEAEVRDILYGAGMEGVTEEQIGAARRDDGTLDYRKIGEMIGNARREGATAAATADLADDAARAAQKAAAEDFKRAEELTENSIKADATSFPRHTDALRRSAQETNWGKDLTGADLDKQIESEWPDDWAQAQAWDKDPLANEMEAARSYATPEEYVNLVDGLTEAQKEKRRRAWMVANNVQGGEAAPVPGVQGAAPVEYPGFEAQPEGSPKALDRSTALQFLQEAGGDKDKARQLAKEAGYDF